jgi:hypothetical protein
MPVARGRRLSSVDTGLGSEIYCSRARTYTEFDQAVSLSSSPENESFVLLARASPRPRFGTGAICFLSPSSCPHLAGPGKLRLSLVLIPVKLSPAISTEEAISFRMIPRALGATDPLPERPETDRGFEEVSEDEIVKGYEHTKGQHVLIRPEELDELKLEAKHTIDMVRFRKARPGQRAVRDARLTNARLFHPGSTYSGQSQPSSLAFSLASLHALARNSDTIIGARGSSLSERFLASVCQHPPACSTSPNSATRTE